MTCAVNNLETCMPRSPPPVFWLNLKNMEHSLWLVLSTFAVDTIPASHSRPWCDHPWTDSSNNGATGRHSTPWSLWQEYDGLHQSPGNYRIRNLSLTTSSSLYLIYIWRLIPLVSLVFKEKPSKYHSSVACRLWWSQMLPHSTVFCTIQALDD